MLLWGSNIGVMKGDARSLDYGSHRISFIVQFLSPCACLRFGGQTLGHGESVTPLGGPKLM